MGRPISRQLGDERINLIYAKSSRNALFATYLALFIHILATDVDTPDTKWLVIMLTAGWLCYWHQYSSITLESHRFHAGLLKYGYN
jgi:hypothetical protein